MEWADDTGMEYEAKLRCRDCGGVWWTRVIVTHGRSDYRDPECSKCDAPGEEID